MPFNEDFHILIVNDKNKIEIWELLKIHIMQKKNQSLINEQFPSQSNLLFHIIDIIQT